MSVHELPIQRKKGIALAIVSGRGLCPVRMVSSIAFQGWPTNTNVYMHEVYGAETGLGRIEAVKQARKEGAKYIWMIDDDTVPAVDAGRKLLYALEQRPDVHVIGGVYTTRSSPPEPLVYREQGAGPDWDWKVGEVFERWGVGTGCMMIRLDVFDHLPEPWFKTVQESDQRWTDDLYFCDLVAQAGFKALVHGGVLCHHYDFERGAIYQLPRNSYPYVNRVGEPSEPELPIAVPTRSGYDLIANPWMTETETIWLIERARQSRRFVEVGCWRGVTTRNVAKNAPDCQVFGVDHFHGSGEHLDRGSRHFEPRLSEPEWLLREAVANLKELTNVQLLSTESESAACSLASIAPFDTVFIDASHDYESVKRDIQVWMPLLPLGGMMCGHDYQYPDVQRAVRESIQRVRSVPGTTLWYAHL